MGVYCREYGKGNVIADRYVMWLGTATGLTVLRSRQQRAARHRGNHGGVTYRASLHIRDLNCRKFTRSDYSGAKPRVRGAIALSTLVICAGK